MKPFLSFEGQAIQLIHRGMQSIAGLSREELIELIIRELRFINYYRLSAYWHPFLLADEKGKKTVYFQDGTYWETIRSYYMFDRRLRSIIFDAISRIEIALRTQIAHIWAEISGCNTPQKLSSFYKTAFTKNKNIQGRTKSPFADLLDSVDKFYKRCNEEFALHHRHHYNIECARDLPIWVFVEFTTFGNLSTLLSRGLPTDVVATIVHNFGFEDEDDIPFFISCINLLNEARNTCAHQGRLWNKPWISGKGTDILKQTKHPSWNHVWNQSYAAWEFPNQNSQHSNTTITKNNRCTATVLTVCACLLRTIAPNSEWTTRVEQLLTRSDLPTHDIHTHLGFNNAHWAKHPLWKK